MKEDTSTLSPLKLLGALIAALDQGDVEAIAQATEDYRALLQGYRLVDEHAEIPLTRGFWAKISCADIQRVTAHKWFVVGEGTRDHPHTARAKISGKAVALSRFILDLSTGDKLFADHINYDNLDDRRENLRILDATQSAQHRRGWRRRATDLASDYKGVYFRSDTPEATRPWRAVIKRNGVPISLGSFVNAHQAAQAYDAAVNDNHGEFGEKNFG